LEPRRCDLSDLGHDGVGIVGWWYSPLIRTVGAALIWVAAANLSTISENFSEVMQSCTKSPTAA